jgi:hypothetical protein
MGSWTTLSKSFFINCFKPDLKLVKVFLTRKIKSLIRKRRYSTVRTRTIILCVCFRVLGLSH